MLEPASSDPEGLLGPCQNPGAQAGAEASQAPARPGLRCGQSTGLWVQADSAELLSPPAQRHTHSPGPDVSARR